MSVSNVRSSFWDGATVPSIKTLMLQTVVGTKYWRWAVTVLNVESVKLNESKSFKLRMADLELCNSKGQNELQTNLDNMFPFDILKITSYYLPTPPSSWDYGRPQSSFIQIVYFLYLYLKEK